MFFKIFQPYCSTVKRIYMNQKDRFTIEPSITNSIRWKVKDNVSGISVSFLEGCYMDNSLYVPDTMKGEVKKEEVSETLKKITEWIGENALDVAVCNVSARCRAIWLLHDAKYLAVIICAIKGVLPNNIDVTKASDILFNKIDHYVHMGDGAEEFYYDHEIVNLLGVISMLSNKEAMEVICLVSVYWSHKIKAKIEIEDFAEDLLLWPSCLSGEQQAVAMGNDSERIEAEDFGDIEENNRKQ